MQCRTYAVQLAEDWLKLHQIDVCYCTLLFYRESRFQAQWCVSFLHAQHQRTPVCLPEGRAGFSGAELREFIVNQPVRLAADIRGIFFFLLFGAVSFTWAGGTFRRAFLQLWVNELQGCSLSHDFLRLGALLLRTWGRTDYPFTPDLLKCDI